MEDSDINESEMSMTILYADGRDRDGVGDQLEIGGINTERHKLNPVCLFDHGKNYVLPIAMAEEPETKLYTNLIDPSNKKAAVRAFFYQGPKGGNSSVWNNEESGIVVGGAEVSVKSLLIDPKKEYEHATFCEQIFDLARKKFLRGGSIGYQVLRAVNLSANYDTGTPAGLHLLNTLMLEASLVVMPANMRTVLAKSYPTQIELAREVLAMPKVCGKSLSPYLVKSFTSCVNGVCTKVVSGYEGKGLMKEEHKHIRHEGGKWILYTRDGSRKLGTHPSKEAAIKQEQAIEAHKHGKAMPDNKNLKNDMEKTFDGKTEVPLESLPDTKIPPAHSWSSRGAVKGPSAGRTKSLRDKYSVKPDVGKKNIGKKGTKGRFAKVAGVVGAGLGGLAAGVPGAIAGAAVGGASGRLIDHLDKKESGSGYKAMAPGQPPQVQPPQTAAQMAAKPPQQAVQRPQPVKRPLPNPNDPRVQQYRSGAPTNTTNAQGNRNAGAGGGLMNRYADPGRKAMSAMSGGLGEDLRAPAQMGCTCSKGEKCASCGHGKAMKKGSKIDKEALRKARSKEDAHENTELDPLPFGQERDVKSTKKGYEPTAAQIAANAHAGPKQVQRISVSPRTGSGLRGPAPAPVTHTPTQAGRATSPQPIQTMPGDSTGASRAPSTHTSNRSSGFGQKKDLKSNTRQKYRPPVKQLRRKVKGGREGTITMKVREKDFGNARKMAQGYGLKCSHMGIGTDGLVKLKLIGYDRDMDEVAKSFGVAKRALGKKSLPNEDTKGKVGRKIGGVIGTGIGAVAGAMNGAAAGGVAGPVGAAVGAGAGAAGVGKLGQIAGEEIGDKVGNAAGAVGRGVRNAARSVGRVVGIGGKKSIPQQVLTEEFSNETDPPSNLDSRELMSIGGLDKEKLKKRAEIDKMRDARRGAGGVSSLRKNIKSVGQTGEKGVGDAVRAVGRGVRNAYQAVTGSKPQKDTRSADQRHPDRARANQVDPKLSHRSPGEDYVDFESEGSPMGQARPRANTHQSAKPGNNYGGGPAAKTKLERNLDTLEDTKDMNRRTKAAPDEMPDVDVPEDDMMMDEDMDPGMGDPGMDEGGMDEDPLAEGGEEHEEIEKYSIQVLRRLHQDAMLLLEQYDEIMELLEHNEIGGYLQNKLQSLASELDEIEGLLGTHHPEASPLDGMDTGEDEGMEGLHDEGLDEPVIEDESMEGMEDEDMGEEGMEGGEDEMGGEGMDDEVDLEDQVEQTNETVPEDLQDPMEASSEEEELPTPEEAIEGMREKSLQLRLTKALRQLYGKSAKGCGECGNMPCTCKAFHKDLNPDGEEMHKGLDEENDGAEVEISVTTPDSNQVDRNLRRFDDHEHKTVSEARDLLKKLSDTYEFTEKERAHCLHHGLNTKDVGWDGGDTVLERAKNLVAGLHVGKDPSWAEFKKAKDLGGGDAATEVDLVEDSGSPEKSYASHRRAIHDASRFLNSLAEERAFGEPHRKQSLLHYLALDEACRAMDPMLDQAEEAQVNHPDSNEQAMPTGENQEIKDDLQEKDEEERAEVGVPEPGEIGEKSAKTSLVAKPKKTFPEVRKADNAVHLTEKAGYNPKVGNEPAQKYGKPASREANPAKGSKLSGKTSLVEKPKKDFTEMNKADGKVYVTKKEGYNPKIGNEDGQKFGKKAEKSLDLSVMKQKELQHSETVAELTKQIQELTALVSNGKL